MVWLHLFRYDAFVRRYESGQTRKLFFDLDYASGGWLGLLVFGGGLILFLWLGVRAAWRVFSRTPAASVDSLTLQIHPSFLWTPRTILLSKVSQVRLCRMGEAMATTSRINYALAQLGGKIIAKRTGRKICLVVSYAMVDLVIHTVRLDAQFIDGGKWALARFGRELKLRRLNVEHSDGPDLRRPLYSNDE